MAGEASYNIRGITIRLGGDASELVKSFKEVDKAAKVTSNALRDVDKLLKIDPGNLTLLKQKQDLLNRSVSETAEKLELAKAKRDELLKDNAGNKNQAGIEALNREIVSLENHLDEVRKKASSFSVLGEQIKAAGANIKSLGDKMQSIGRSLATHVTAPIVAIGTASIAAWKQVDDALDIVTAKTGASGKALEELQNIVKDVATSIPTSFEAAGTAVGEVNTRFGLTGKALEDLSKQFIKFAQVNGVDLNESIDSVQKAMDAFGLSADQAGAFLDTLNKVGQDTGVNVGELTRQMVTNATALQSMGMNAADAASLLGDLEKSGIDTSVVMTGFSKVQKEALESGVTMQQAFRKALSSSESAIDIFGAKAGPKLYQAFQNGTLSVDMFAGGVHKLDDALGNLDNTFEAVTDPSDNLQMAMNELMLAGHDLGEVIQKELAPIIVEVTKALREFRQWFVSLDDDTKQMIVRSAAIVAALGPVLVIIGSVISAIGTIVNGIGAVVGLGPKLVGFFSSMTGAATTAQAAASGVGSAMTSAAAASTAAGGAMTSGAAAGSTAATIMGSSIAAVAAAGTAAVAAWGVAGYQIASHWNELKDTFNVVGGYVKSQINLTVASVNLLATKGKIAFDQFSASARDAINIGMTNIRTSVSTGLTNANNLFTAFGTQARNTIQVTMSNIQSRTSGAMESMRANIQNAMNAAHSNINSSMSSIQNNISNAMGNIKTHMSSTFSEAASSFTSKMGELKTQSVSVWSNIVSTISGAITNIKNAIANTVLKFGSVTVPTFSWSGKNDSTKGTTAQINVGSKTVNYASAMAGGAILKGATIFGAMGDKLLQAGEVGSEVVVGTNSLMNMIARTARANSNNSTLIAGVGAIYSLLTQYLPEAAADKSIVLDTGKLVGALASPLNRQLGLMMG